MSIIEFLLQAEAAEQQSAVRRTAYRHRHLEPKPLVVCVYNMGGEAAAPIAIAYGTSPTGMKIQVAAEPRNRDSRFSAINAFSDYFAAYIGKFLDYTTETVYRKGKPPRAVHTAKKTPQIIVPNAGTVQYLNKLGRSLRYLGGSWGHPVPEETQWTGSHLTWFSHQAQLPGQSVFLAATQLLRQHYATGQSALEDENLATLLAWISNVPGSGLAAIRDAESGPALGPLPDPDWEVQLEPLTKKFSRALEAGDSRLMNIAHREVKALVTPPMEAAYAATHQAIALMRSIPEAPSVADRWNVDCGDWSRHCVRASSGIPRFQKRDDRTRATRNLSRWTRALNNLQVDEAFDDPMLMAELDAAGHCLTGTVTTVTLTKRVKPGNKIPTSTPVLEVSLDSATHLLPGTAVVWVANRKVTGVVDSVPAIGVAGKAQIAILKGDSGGSHLPSVGQSVVFLDELPTNIPPTDPPRESWVTDDSTARSQTSEQDGSPDLTIDQLVALPVVGTVDVSTVPGVVE